MQDGVGLVQRYRLRDVRHIGNVAGDADEPGFRNDTGKARQLRIECDGCIPARYECTYDCRSEKSAAACDEYAHLVVLSSPTAKSPPTLTLPRKRRRESKEET